MNERTREQPQPRRRFGPAAAGLFALLVLPAAALARLARVLDARFIAGYIVVISLLTYFLYRHDKRRAQSAGRRTPESALHFLELIGGWPGAFLAQRLLRHKNAKMSYQVNFWCIVALHQLVSFEFLHDWGYAKKLLALLYR